MAAKSPIDKTISYGKGNVKMYMGKSSMFGEMLSRTKKPPPKKLLDACVGILREGPGSIAAQFEQKRTLLPTGGYISWPETKEFGTRAEHAPMDLTSAYKKAWTGKGRGKVQKTQTTKSRWAVIVGIDPKTFPAQSWVFQMSEAPSVKIKVTKAMRKYLAWAFSVYISKKKRRILVKPRRIALGRVAINRCLATVENWVATGKVVPAETGFARVERV